MKTAGKWSWKLKFSKECVKTHLPNLLALKMDCAKAFSIAYTRPIEQMM